MNVIKGSPDRRMMICVVRADDFTRIIARRDLNDVAALIYYLPIKIITPAEQGLLGLAGVPPRRNMSEDLITISIPTRKSRVK